MADFVLYITRGITLSAAMALFILLMGALPAHRTAAWIAWLTVVCVAASIWTGLEASHG